MFKTQSPRRVYQWIAQLRTGPTSRPFSTFIAACAWLRQNEGIPADVGFTTERVPTGTNIVAFFVRSSK